jgi:PAS domain S-box-containing protein
MISDFKEISRIKELLGKSPKGMSITELAAALDLHRNTVAKYLDALQLKGDVDLKKIGTAKNYFLTTRVPASSIHAFCRSDYILANGRMEVVLVGGAMEWTDDPAAVRPGQRIPDILPALAHHPDFLEHCQAALNGEDILREIRIFVGGQERHLRLNFLPVVFDDGREGLGLLLEDLTTLRAAETELAQCRDRYRALFEEQEACLFRASPDGTIISANRSFCRRVRTIPEEIIGFPHVPMISGADRTRLAQAISGLAPDSPNASIVYQATDADGKNRWEEWSFRGLFGSDGELVEYLATGRDITDFRRMEE